MRTLLVVIVLVPFLSTAGLLGVSAYGAWTTRHNASTTAVDASTLGTVASARAEMNTIEFPIAAISYTAQLGISEPVLDQLLHPSTPFREQLTTIAHEVSSTPTYFTTAALRGDITELLNMVRNVDTSQGVPYSTVLSFFTKMGSDIDSVWYGDYDRLQSDITRWQPPGSIEEQVAALRQIYAAFLAGNNEVSGAIYVLEGIGPANAKQLLVQAAGIFNESTAQFVGRLGPLASQAWDHLRVYPSDAKFAATIQQGVSVALTGSPPPFAGNLAFASSSMAPSIRYVADLNALVTAASHDLQDAAHSQASSAAQRLVSELALLSLIALVCLATTGLIARMITRPLAKLAWRAQEVHEGNFQVPALEEVGPREVVSTTAAFNDMTSTLRAVEAKAIALAVEDLASEDLLTPLPGRTGRALQASIDALSQQIQQREVQRKMLNDAATHDSLTGLLNRSAVLEYLTHDVSRRREAGDSVAVIFVDLDGLKPLNDQYGHEVGDTAILATALALEDATATCDVVGRLGGDEFLVVLCHDHSCGAETSVERIHDRVGRCRVPVGDGQLLPLEASLGIAITTCSHETDPMTLVREADTAMYAAKKAARLHRQQVSSVT